MPELGLYVFHVVDNQAENGHLIKLGYTTDYPRRMKDYRDAIRRRNANPANHFICGFQNPNQRTTNFYKHVEQLFHKRLFEYRAEDYPQEVYRFRDKLHAQETLTLVHDHLHECGWDVEWLTSNNEYINFDQLDGGVFIEHSLEEGDHVACITEDSEGIQPRLYQVSIIDTINLYFADNDRGVVQCPPGYGKTYISALHCWKAEYKRILVFCPYKQICYEFLQPFKLLGYKVMINNGDENFDKRKCISNKHKIVVISTYQSSGPSTSYQYWIYTTPRIPKPM
jgi:hypothetical protein